MSSYFRLTSGTTWHSAAMLNLLRGNVVEGELVGYTGSLVTSGALEGETGVSPGWIQNGSLSVTSDPERMKEWR